MEMITKNITIGSLDVDPDNGKIWLNCPECLLRIQNIRFSNIEEKFSMIDINGVDATMFPGSLMNEPYSDFLEKITVHIIPKLIKLKDLEIENFLDKLSVVIKEEVNKWES
jgi:hypothetical protein